LIRKSRLRIWDTYPKWPSTSEAAKTDKLFNLR
jgi:hypothetical protein